VYSAASAAVHAVPVTTGFTWTTAAVSLLNLLVGGVLVAIIRSRPALKKLANEREASLLAERASEMDRMRKRIDVLEADLRATTHKLNNVTQAFEWMLDSLEFNPERSQEIAAKARVMRNGQMQAEATEKAAVLGAKANGGETA
jgi:hypothetical protein